MPYKLIGHIPCGTEACTTATHSSSECNSVDGNIKVDLTPVAKESTLLAESQVIQESIANIDLSSVESKVEEEATELKITLQEVKDKVSNITIDLSPVAKEETTQDILSAVNRISIPPTAILEDDGYYTIDFGSANITIE